jgi:hypothetical protein
VRGVARTVSSKKPPHHHLRFFSHETLGGELSNPKVAYRLQPEIRSHTPQIMLSQCLSNASSCVLVEVRSTSGDFSSTVSPELVVICSFLVAFLVVIPPRTAEGRHLITTSSPWMLTLANGSTESPGRGVGQLGGSTAAI